jgi:uncharacterized protein YecT (DUF1311 family)
MNTRRTARRRVTREDVKALADAIAREIRSWCYHHHGNVSECLTQHIEYTDSYDMYVPEEYQTLYKRVLRSRRKTAALDRAVRARLRKALAKAPR